MLCCFVTASAPEAVASTRASAKVVLVNMVTVSCLCSPLTPSWCALASCWCGGARVNQPDVSPMRAQAAGEQDESACFSRLCSFLQPQAGGCFSPGNEVLFSLIQRGIGEGTPCAAIIQPASPVRLARPVGSRGGR